jgi:hypothetical protein
LVRRIEPVTIDDSPPMFVTSKVFGAVLIFFAVLTLVAFLVHLIKQS